MGELLAVAAELDVAPERRPAGANPLPLQLAGAQEVGLRFQAVGPQVRPVGERAVDRVADDGDQADLRQLRSDAGVARLAPQVERRALEGQLSGGRVLEETFV